MRKAYILPHTLFKVFNDWKCYYLSDTFEVSGKFLGKKTAVSLFGEIAVFLF
jgi:hypothetical protein